MILSCPGTTVEGLDKSLWGGRRSAGRRPATPVLVLEMPIFSFLRYSSHRELVATTEDVRSKILFHVGINACL